METIKVFFVGFILVWAISTTFLLFKGNFKEQKDVVNIEAVSDTIRRLNDTTIITKIVEMPSRQFKNLESDDKNIQELKELLVKYQDYLKKEGSVTKIETNTILQTEILRDTSYIYPTYKMKNEWVDISFHSIDSTFDNIDFSLKFINKYNVILGYDKKNIFSKKVPHVIVENRNPYSETSKLKSFVVDDKSKYNKFGLGFQLGYGYSNSNSKFSPYVGIGLNYNIINF